MLNLSCLRGLVPALATALLASPATAQTVPADTPAAFGVAGRAVVATLHGVGAQIYQCKAGADGKAAWVFREPVATLIQDGVTLGRHFAGPTWALADGGVVKGKVAATAPGAAPTDIAQLKLDMIDHQGAGLLKDATAVLRLSLIHI